MKISIVCVYNNRKILDEFLLKSLLSQENIEYETILIDNTDSTFVSASQALNHGGAKASGDYITFLHQDIMFTSPNALEEIAQYLNDKNKLYGVAGVRDSNGVITNITQGQDFAPAGYASITEPVLVQTLDECMFIVPKEVFEKLKFDESTITGWHLYCVDYCLSAKKIGVDSYVIPSDDVYHLSPGFSMNNTYFRILRKLIKKHSEFPVIYTTMGVWPTNILQLNHEIFSRNSRRIAKDIIAKLEKNL